jgi:hypothetical protein
MSGLWTRWGCQLVKVSGTVSGWTGTSRGVDEIGIERAEDDGQGVFIPWTALLAIRRGP